MDFEIPQEILESIQRDDYEEVSRYVMQLNVPKARILTPLSGDCELLGAHPPLICYAAFYGAVESCSLLLSMGVSPFSMDDEVCL